jgi:hypothetical protein
MRRGRDRSVPKSRRDRDRLHPPKWVTWFASFTRVRPTLSLRRIRPSRVRRRRKRQSTIGGGSSWGRGGGWAAAQCATAHPGAGRPPAHQGGGCGNCRPTA